MTVKLTLPQSLSPGERAREAASILASAIARLHASRPRENEFPLGFSATKRVHTTPSIPGVPR
jgi:hypothetical protein